MEPYESVTFLPAEAQFVANTMFAWSQNQAVGSESDQGAVVPITKSERQKALDIVAKVNKQISNASSGPISFTQPEAYMMTYLYIKYIQTHGKPQGDLDWTYYIRFDDTSNQLIVNIIRKLGGNVSNLPATTYPQGFNPFPRL
jgi:hypothetical protein